MRGRIGYVVFFCSILLVAVILASCSGGGTSGTTTTTAGTGTTAGGGTSVQIIMNNRSYDPKTVTIGLGGTVTWVNQEALRHDVVADNGEFNSGLFGEGETFSFTFSAAGTYPYHCSIHPGMTGTVIVQ